MDINPQQYPEFDPHALYRIKGRLADYVEQADLIKACAAARRFQKETKVYVLLKSLDEPIRFYENTYDVSGNSLVAVIRSGKVITLMIAWSNRKYYFRRDSRLGLVSI
jgi:hypothetical protein